LVLLVYHVPKILQLRLLDTRIIDK